MATDINFNRSVKDGFTKVEGDSGIDFRTSFSLKDKKAIQNKISELFTFMEFCSMIRQRGILIYKGNKLIDFK